MMAGAESKWMLDVVEVCVEGDSVPFLGGGEERPGAEATDDKRTSSANMRFDLRFSRLDSVGE